MRKYKEPNRKKPRFRDNEFRTDLVKDLFYDRLKKDYPDVAKKYTEREAKDIVHSLMRHYRETSVSNSMGIKLPKFCGDISVKYINVDKRPYDSKKSNKHNLPIEHLNWNSNGKLGKVVWEVSNYTFNNAMLPYFGFEGTRELVQTARDGMLNTPDIYKMTKTSKSNLERTIDKNQKKDAEALNNIKND
jgi:hypothetical protein